MKSAPKWLFLLFLGLMWSGCSSFWQRERSPSAQDFDHYEGEILPDGPVSFNSYHNIRPTRSSGGEFYEVRFLRPKSLREISFEFINHKVKLYQIELIKSSGETVPLRGFRPRFLNKNQKIISLRNLSQTKDILAVRFKAEGFESSNVSFTVSFFSPNGFVPIEQGKALALRPFESGRGLGNSQVKKLPKCVIQNPQLSHVIFESEQLASLSNTEKKYFCRHFIPQFEKLMQRHESVSQFLRTGEDLEKPLISLGGHFSYDPYENHITFPFKLKKDQFSQIAQRLDSHYKTPRRNASRGLSQEDEMQYGLKQSYEEYMNSSTNPDLSYHDEQASGKTSGQQRKCLQKLVELGVRSSQAKSYCQEVIGHELEHVSCVEFLEDQYILAGNAHHYCLEANGKLSKYRPCMKKLLSMDMNHYDSNLFCQRTPVEYMQDQLTCVEEMSLAGQSQYKSVRTCQKAWGKERSLISCLRKAQASDDPKKAAGRCSEI